MELKTAIARRKSTRAYTPNPVSDTAIDTILKAGAAGPVGMGKYENIHFTVVQDKELLSHISAAAAKARGTDDDPLYAAPLFILVSALPSELPGLNHVNAACITENMLLAAEELGIGSVIIWSSALGIAADSDLAASLEIPDGFEPVLGAVFGTPAAADNSEKPLDLRIAVNRL